MINIGGGAMPKVRIYELAKMLKIENKELIEKLKELGIEAKSHMSVLTEEDAAVVMEMFDSNSIIAQEKKEEPEEKQENQNHKKGKHKKQKPIVMPSGNASLETKKKKL